MFSTKKRREKGRKWGRERERKGTWGRCGGMNKLHGGGKIRNKIYLCCLLSKPF